MSSDSNVLILTESEIVSENLEEFLAQPKVDVVDRKFAVAHIEWVLYGHDKYSILSISVSVLSFDSLGNLDLPKLILASTRSETLLPQQRVLIRNWIMTTLDTEYGVNDVWKRTFAHVKQTLR